MSSDSGFAMLITGKVSKRSSLLRSSSHGRRKCAQTRLNPTRDASDKTYFRGAGVHDGLRLIRSVIQSF